jgi:hypothetical protein
VNALLERLGWVYLLLAVPVVLLPTLRARVVGGAGLALVGLAAAAQQAAPGPATRGFLMVNTALALVGMLGIGTALMVGRRLSPQSGPELPDAAAGTGFSLDGVAFAGLVIALLAPQLLLLALGVALCLASALRATIRARRPLALVPLIAAAIALSSAFGLLFTLLGPLGMQLGALAQGPVSPAAERVLALLIIGSALVIAGVPPLDRMPWGLGLAPLAAILLGRLVVPVFPEGLVLWQAPAVLILALALSWASATGRWTRACVATGLLGLCSGERNGVIAGVVLVLWGWLVETGVAFAARRGGSPSQRWGGVLALPAVLAALPALTASLRVQALLSTLALGGAVGGLLRVGWGRPALSPGPLY